MTRTHRARGIAVVVGLLLATTACGAKDRATQAIVDDALEDSGVEIDGLGTAIPDSFPAEIPLPEEGVDLESAIGTGGTYAMRYGVTDPAAAVAAYRAALEAAGLTIELDFDNLGGAANNVGFTATGAEWDVTVSAFGEQPVDGLYMAVVVAPLL